MQDRQVLAGSATQGQNSMDPGSRDGDGDFQHENYYSPHGKIGCTISEFELIC